MTYTLGSIAALQLALEDEFNEYCKNINLKNPFEIDALEFQKITHHRPDGLIEVDFGEGETILELNKEEKKVYSLIKYMYMLDRIFEEAGYEAAKDRVELWKKPAITEYFKRFRPCEGSTGQCSMECREYLNCKISQ